MMSDEEMFDVERWRRDFPALDRTVDERPLIYLDSAATSLKPRQVIHALSRFYADTVGTVHRGVHRGGREVNEQYREARRTMALLIGADDDEIVFLSNCTEALNLVAMGHPACRDRPLVVTDANHHSAFLPFARNNELRRARLHVDGTVDLDDLEQKLDGAGLLCLPHVSNALGWLMPVAEAVALARRAGALVLLDGAQSVPHLPLDVEELDIDFLAWSGHKMLAPFGIGALYGRADQLARLEPQRWGGGMVEEVKQGRAMLRTVPERLEAGTPNVGGAVALAAAVDYLEEIGLERIHQHVSSLTCQARQLLRQVPDLSVHGPNHDDGAVSAVSFSFPGMASHALARLLSDRFGIMVRSGHHCAQPLHETLGWGETVRASFYLYSRRSEIEALFNALTKIRQTLKS